MFCCNRRQVEQDLYHELYRHSYGDFTNILIRVRGGEHHDAIIGELAQIVPSLVAMTGVVGHDVSAMRDSIQQQLNEARPGFADEVFNYMDQILHAPRV